MCFTLRAAKIQSIMVNQAVMAMNGKITTWFKDKGLDLSKMRTATTAIFM